MGIKIPLKIFLSTSQIEKLSIYEHFKANVKAIKNKRQLYILLALITNKNR